MADIPVQQLATAGSQVAYQAASAGGDAFLNSGNETLHVRNGGAGSINVTLAAQNACNHGSLHNLVVAVANTVNTEAQIKRLDPQRYNDGNRKVQITYSAVTSVFVAVTV